MTVELEDGPGGRSADELLVAIGRRPRTEDLGLETWASSPARASRWTTACEPAGDWLYAIGDVNGRTLLTHMGKYQARMAADVILGKDARRDAPTARRHRG